MTNVADCAHPRIGEPSNRSQDGKQELQFADTLSISPALVAALPRSEPSSMVWLNVTMSALILLTIGLMLGVFSTYS